ncbi:MAG: hypothetical protein QOE36_815 [Gaiellaceae bacterium]|nr:hypothetical protein [Gaiellaceae bacterium]
MVRNWTEFLQGSANPEHAVQIYADLGELAESVAAYLVAGFEAGEPAVVIATPEHLGYFTERLAASGWDARRIEEQGLLEVADAEATLARLMVDDAPSAVAFEQVVGRLLDQIADRFPERRMRAFGEMVDLLCARGRPEAANALEELWNAAARRRNFSLLCGYRLDVFDRASQIATLPGVCRSHSHVRPAHDPERLARAVGLALDEVLGAADAGKVYVLVGQQMREDKVPVAQLVLMWVSANMPVLADRILGSARTHYIDDPVVV